MELPDYPPKVDIKTEIYETLPETTKILTCWDTFDAPKAARDVVAELSAALQQKDYQAVRGLFAVQSSHWKDTLALTAHLRSFKGRDTIASALSELHDLRKVQNFQFDEVKIVTATDDLVRFALFHYRS